MADFPGEELKWEPKWRPEKAASLLGHGITDPTQQEASTRGPTWTEAPPQRTVPMSIAQGPNENWKNCLRLSARAEPTTRTLIRFSPSLEIFSDFGHTACPRGRHQLQTPTPLIPYARRQRKTLQKQTAPAPPTVILPRPWRRSLSRRSGGEEALTSNTQTAATTAQPLPESSGRAPDVT